MTTAIRPLKINRIMQHHHNWTDAERDIVRRDYAGTDKSAEDIAARLTLLCGDTVTRFAVKGQCQRLGIMAHKPPEWTPESVERLHELAPRLAPATIARKLGRSTTAVIVKMKREKIHRRDHIGWYTKKEVCEILGVDHHKVQKWMDSGELIAKPHGELHPQNAGQAMWHIYEKDLRTFIIRHSFELVGRNVDLFSIVSILAPAGNHAEELN